MKAFCAKASVCKRVCLWKLPVCITFFFCKRFRVNSSVCEKFCVWMFLCCESFFWKNSVQKCLQWKHVEKRRGSPFCPLPTTNISKIDFFCRHTTTRRAGSFAPSGRQSFFFLPKNLLRQISPGERNSLKKTIMIVSEKLIRSFLSTAAGWEKHFLVCLFNFVCFRLRHKSQPSASPVP